jgi:hypothetical protein
VAVSGSHVIVGRFADTSGGIQILGEDCHGLSTVLPDGNQYWGELNDAFPNPFNPFTTISFSLRHPATACLRIYDVSGRLIRTLIDGGNIDAGEHEYKWNGRDDAGHPVASGVYLYRLATDEFTEAKRMTLVR